VEATLQLSSLVDRNGSDRLL